MNPVCSEARWIYAAAVHKRQAIFKPDNDDWIVGVALNAGEFDHHFPDRVEREKPQGTIMIVAHRGTGNTQIELPDWQAEPECNDDQNLSCR